MTDHNQPNQDAINWIPINDETSDLYCKTVGNNGDTLILFDTGETCKWIDVDWPAALATHFEG